ncbi:DUF2924 domain-containing protein [Methylopila henanensis]|uniref:DUF2924 domain-containing protein n=1 Tax=Methylopila henanensis TaxID=873516 RepID=A0ABW4K3B3_9HYPH
MARQTRERIEVEVARLGDLDLAVLQARWRSVTGKAAPAAVSKGLLLRMLAYRVQADALGDLDADTARFLDRVASSPTTAAVPLPDRERIGGGGVLVREWEGVIHRVIALKDGYAWNGGTYRSLSEVARAITGVRWNGPRFFGLRDKGRAG